MGFPNLKYNLRFRIVLPEGYYSAKSGRILEREYCGATATPNWPVEEMVAHIWSYEFYGDPYPYCFDAPTPSRLNQWWSEGVRKFVLHDGKEKIKLEMHWVDRETGQIYLG